MKLLFRLMDVLSSMRMRLGITGKNLYVMLMISMLLACSFTKFVLKIRFSMIFLLAPEKGLLPWFVRKETLLWSKAELMSRESTVFWKSWSERKCISLQLQRIKWSKFGLENSLSCISVKWRKISRMIFSREILTEKQQILVI